MYDTTIALPEATAAAAFLAVSFGIDRQHYALPISAVAQVIRLPALTLLAGAPAWLAGLLNLRGSYLPVLDGRTLLGEPAHCDLNSQVLIIGESQGDTITLRLGLLVDRVYDVQSILPGQIVPLRDHVASELLHGVVTLEGHSVLIFDEAALLERGSIHMAHR